MHETSEDNVSIETNLKRLKIEIDQLYIAIDDIFRDDVENNGAAKSHLRQAEQILAEKGDVKEALAQVDQARNIIAYKDSLRQWATTWGAFTLVYALFWLILFITGFLFTDQIREFFDIARDDLALRAAWFAALSGGIGATVGMLYSLYWHIVMKKDFVPQFIRYYLPQPVIGVIFGAAAYFIILAIAFVLSFEFDPSNSPIVALQIVTAWIAGFRNRLILNKIKRFGQRFASTK